MTGADAAHAAGRREGWDAALAAVAAELRAVAPTLRLSRDAHLWAARAVERVAGRGPAPPPEPAWGARRSERNDALDELLAELPKAQRHASHAAQRWFRAAIEGVRHGIPCEPGRVNRAAEARSGTAPPGHPPGRPYREPAPGESVLLAVLRLVNLRHSGNSYVLRVLRGANAQLVLRLENEAGTPLTLSHLAGVPWEPPPAFCPGGDSETVDAVLLWAAANARSDLIRCERALSAR